MTDHDADEREKAEALALAEALERRVSDDTDRAPQDVLETAALLRYSAGEGELPDARSDAILQELLSQASPAPPARRRWWLWGASTAAVTAAALLAVLATRQPSAPSPAAMAPSSTAGPAAAMKSAAATPRNALPTPPPALLSAQAAASRKADGRRVLDEEMGRYRESVLRAVEARYPQTFGLWVAGDQQGRHP